MPRVEYQTLEKLASISKPATDLWDKICYSISSVLPHTLGYPSDTTQSQYYPTVSSRLSAQDITEVSNALQRVGIWPENTRLRKENPEESHLITVLQASTEIDARMVETNDNNSSRVHLRRGDHHKALTKICSHLNQALEFTSNEAQKSILSKYIESFTTGDLEAYRNSQKLWVQDKYPRVENIFGFVEQYRDPAGIRSEFQALVAIDNQEESKVLMKLVEQSDGFIRKLPWARGSTTNNGKGPFEKIKFEPPSFASIHSKFRTNDFRDRLMTAPGRLGILRDISVRRNQFTQRKDPPLDVDTYTFLTKSTVRRYPPGSWLQERRDRQSSCGR